MKTDILIIGGSAAGFVAASSAKMKYPDKEIIIVRKEEKVMIPCGIPYVYGTVESTNKNILPDAGLEKAGIKIQIDEATDVNTENKSCQLKSGTEIKYDKLIFATGSTPIHPKWLKGSDLKNVFTIPKDKVYLDDLQKKIEDKNNIIVVGAGFIGVEFADEINKTGKNVTLIERLPNILSTAFDKEIVIEAENLIKERGIKVITGTGISEIKGSNKVETVILEDGLAIEADAIVLSMGYNPNTELAEKSGLKINEKGFIRVDEYLRTNIPDVYAAGDCAEKRDFFTRKISTIMLASTACAEARVLGYNLYRLSTPKSFSGTIAIYSTAIGDTAFATAGMNEKIALKENFDIITGSFEGIDRHPGSLPDTHKQMVKLIFSKENGILLGGEIIGGKSAGEIINIIGFAIENHMTLNSILTSQIGTHPLLTASPAAYPLIKAAEMAYKKM